MKKKMILLTAMVMALMLNACGGKANEPAPKETEAMSTEVLTQEVVTEAETETSTEFSEATMPETETQPEETTAAETAPAADNDVVTPSFKESMDAYEEFFDEYVEFMKNYDTSDISQLMEYTNLMTKYMEAMQKMSELQSEAMTDADLAYYIEVTARIEKKLLSVAS